MVLLCTFLFLFILAYLLLVPIPFKLSLYSVAFIVSNDCLAEITICTIVLKIRVYYYMEAHACSAEDNTNLHYIVHG